MTVLNAICRLTRIGRVRPMRAALCAAVIAACTHNAAQAQTVGGNVHVDMSQGFVRILVHLAEEVESDVHVAGGIVIVHFKRPVDVGIEKLTHSASNIIGAARRDPDGRGFRLALSRKAAVNSMAAGERLYIDLLPETWKGLAPGLPKEVIEELSRRARLAERSIRAQRDVVKRDEVPARIRVATQPTFTRYVFELPEVIAVSADRGTNDITLKFAARLKFDFGDVKARLPSTVKAVEAFDQAGSVAVRFALNGKADIRTFREDKNYVLDVGSSDAKEAVAPVRADDVSQLISEVAKKAGPLAGAEPPQTIAAAAPLSAKPEQASSQPPAAAPVPEAARAAPAPRAAAAAAVAMPRETAAPVPADSQREPPARSASGSQPARAAPESQPARAASESQPARVAPESQPARVAPESQPRPAVAPALGVPPAEDGSAVTAGIGRDGDSVRLTFPFPTPTPAAIFRRAGTLWMVFDTRGPITLPDFGTSSGGMIRHALGTALPDGYVIRLMLDRPRLVGATAEAGTWTITLGDTVSSPSAPLSVDRSKANAARPSIAIPLEQARELHRIADPEMGDSLLVVTAPGPTRGFIKPQDFVEFRALASTHGVALQPLADDVQVELVPDNIIIARPGGLTLSGPGAAARASAHRSRVFDPQLWGFDRQADITERQHKLIAAAADMGETKRNIPRLELARFFLSRDMYPEAKGVLDVALSEDRPTADDPSALVLRAITTLMLNRPEDALKELNHPMLGDQLDAPLWRAFAHARLGKWEEAGRGFRNAQAAIATLPVELQRIALTEAIRTAIELRDYETAQNLFGEFQSVGSQAGTEPALSVLQGRLAQGLGKNGEALRNFRQAADSDDRPSAAQGQLRSLALRYDMGELKRPELITELETLTTIWRGDETEIEALQKLARLYTEEQRYRDAFYVMRSALKAHPNAQASRRIYDEAAVTFDSLFLAGRGDALPAIEALGLFYDFRELTPIGRRGDEMIRRLADRLVSVDLLPQAAELLQYQIDNRLQGAARAHVATRLAVIYLMDNKPGRAQSVLRATRSAELNTDLRNLRLLLEARALSDTGRHDVALEVIGNVDNRQAVRLRADILWSAKRFNESAEQIELMYGERWRDFAPLSDVERADVLRAAIGYSLAEDTIGAERLRERYEAKMTDGPDKRAFEIATAPHAANGAEFHDLAKAVTAFSALDTFLRDMRERYPEIGTLSPGETQQKIQDHSRARYDTEPTASVTPRR
jgi:tetratricopeptide (TPR) repeat protein